MADHYKGGTMASLDVLLFLSFIFVCILITRRFSRGSTSVKGNKLPGPKPLPILGNSLSVDFRHLHISLFDMVKEYGKIFQINLMGQTAVVINDPTLVRKAIASEEYGDVFNDRPDNFFGKYLLFDYSDIAFAKTNKITMTKRKMFHRALKFYGDGVEHFERNAEDEFKRFLDELNNTKQKDFDFNEILRKSFANTTVLLMTGKPAGDDDSRLIWQYIDNANWILDVGISFIYDLIPPVRFFPGQFGNMFRKAKEARDIFLERYYFRLKNPVSRIAEEEQPGFVKTLIRLQKEENEHDPSNFIGENHMKGMVVDITFAAAETTTTALTNAFALLIVHRHVTKRIQQEVDDAVGSARMPNLSDKHRMPYTMATVHEVLRYTSAAGPLSVPHRALRDQNFEGYLIPKKSIILPNFWYIHRDPNLWKDPWTFNPERFLDADGKLLPPEHGIWHNVLVFSIGHRDCPGKNLAKSRMFLYLATVLQSFDIIPGSSGVLPDVNPCNYIPGLNLRIQNHMCRAVPRVS